jgi:hypothetical protein
MTSRREFLEVGAMSLGAATIGFASTVPLSPGMTVAFVRDPLDPIASGPSVTWALQTLGTALEKHGFRVRPLNSITQLTARDFGIVVAGNHSFFRMPILGKDSAQTLKSAEALALVPTTHGQTPLLVALGSDARGLVYALLELTDRLIYAEDPTQALSIDKPIVESPANEFRGICRPFVSDIEDKPWFYDRANWPDYFAMLATQRFNRFHLALGLGYDFLKGVTDSYLLFAYPFLLDVPGYSVRAINLPDAERERNLEALQYISRQAVLHGIDFQLGLWTHGYQFADSPNVNYTISGLNSANHAAYCRDALALLLQKCPDISGITLRTHYESGVKEGNYGFWKTVFDGVPKSGRQLQIDLHVKGLDQQMLANATATGMPIMLTPKYWAEHMGLPYQQASIRELEMPKADVTGKDYSTLSEGSRIFTRYGYADFLTDARPYKFVYRVFPGSHKFLLWGDPVSMAAHSHAFQFCGSDGAEFFEPLSFKGRRGSGLSGGRNAYADASLNPQRDWEKYLYTYRVCGRLLYNPNADPDTWRRQLRHQFPTTAPQVEIALAAATRILPLITTAHLPSAAHDTYWPELYTNQSLFDPNAPSPYGDTPAPKTFVNVSPLDPEMFSRITDFAGDLLEQESTGKYSPLEVAIWLSEIANLSARNLAKAEEVSGQRASAEFRRLAIDVKIQIALGRFFANKLHGGVLYALYQQTGHRTALDAALSAYRQARMFWSQLATDASHSYVGDITYGPLHHQRGDWLNRLPGIDDDLAAIEKQLASSRTGAPQDARAKSAYEKAQDYPRRTFRNCLHTSPTRFTPGAALEIALTIYNEPQPLFVRLHYRHVDQAELYQAVDMQPDQATFHATIPVEYTNSKYPLQYYFEIRRGPNDVTLYPAFDSNLTNTPYFVVRTK